MIGGICKYFGWGEKDVLMMSYEKFIMYLATIPNYSKNKEGDSDTSNACKSEAQITGSFNLFDLDQR